MRSILCAILIAVSLSVAASAESEVCMVQRRLSQLGYFDGPQNCIYGPMTGDAVAKFQRDNGLYVDGIAGEDTKRMLFADRERTERPRDIRRAMSEQDRFAKCGDDIISASVMRGWKGRGIKGAIKAWQYEVRGPGGLGLEYAQWENATDKKLECLPVGVMSVVNCTARARPCRAGQ
jgi:hypothetical protein